MNCWMRGAALGWASIIGVFGNGFVVTEARAVASAPAAAEGRLNETIQRAMRAEGPFFTPAEQAVIERKCGYAPGQWDGHQVNISDGVFHCTNGRKVDDAEMRALLEVAEPRISRRVESVMESAEVQKAISDVAEQATAEALRAVGESLRRRR